MGRNFDETTGKIRMPMGILAAAALCLALIPGLGTFAGRIRKTGTMRGKIKIQELRQDAQQDRAEQH